jgi:hypothetical protein
LLEVALGSSRYIHLVNDTLWRLIFVLFIKQRL